MPPPAAGAAAGAAGAAPAAGLPLLRTAGAAVGVAWSGVAPDNWRANDGVRFAFTSLPDLSDIL